MSTDCGHCGPRRTGDPADESLRPRKTSWLTGEPLYAARGRWMCGWVRRSQGWLDAGPIREGDIEQLRKDFAFGLEALSERAKYDYERLLRRYARIMMYDLGEI